MNDGFAAGLVNRRKALEERKNMPAPSVEIDEDNPFGDGLPEEGDETEETQDQEEETPDPPAAAPPPKPGHTRSGKKIGRPRGRKTKPAETAAAPPAPAASLSEEEQVGKNDIGEGVSPTDPRVQWPIILDKARSEGVSPDMIQISIERAAIGVAATPFAQIDTIGGDVVSVSGDDSVDAGQLLVDYVTNVIHLARKSPARYKLFARYRTRQVGSFRVMHLTLDHPDEIKAMLMRKADFFNHQRPQVGLSGMGYAPPRAPSWPSQTPTLPAPPPPAAPTTPPGPMDQLKQWREWEEFRQGLLAANQPAPPPMPMPQIIQAPPPPPPTPVVLPLTKEQEELIWEARMARFIKDQGYIKPGEAPATKPAEIKDRASGFRDIILAFKELETFKEQIRGVVGGGETSAEEEPEPEVKPEDKITLVPIPIGGGRSAQLPRNTKGAVDFFQQWFSSNPELSMELGVRALGGLAQALDKTSFGKVLEGLAARGGPPAQLAQQAQAVGLQGTGPVNGAAAVGPRIRSPQA